MKLISNTLGISNVHYSNVGLYCILGIFSVLVLGYFLSPFIVLFAIYALTIYFSIKNNRNTLIYFIIFVFLQNIAMILLANKFTDTQTTLFMISKELMLYGCFVIYFLKNPKMDKFEASFIVYLCVLALSFFMSDAAIYSRIVAFRQLCLPMMCIFFGYHLYVKVEDVKKIENCILGFCIAIGLFGLVELYVLGDEFWHLVPLRKFNINKGTDFVGYNELPGNFYTWDYLYVIGKKLRRMTSIFGDPLMSGGMIFTGIVIADSLRKSVVYNGKYILAELFLIFCGFLTLSKGYYMAIAIFIGMKLFVKFGYKRMKATMRVVIVCVVLAIIGGKVLLNVLPHSSTTIHLSGLYNGISNGTILGNGLGKAGIIANELTGLNENLAEESFIGVLLAQIGYVGLFAFIFIMGSFIWKSIKKYCFVRDIRLYNYAVMVIAVLCQSLFSESSIGIVVTGTSFILLGLVVKNINTTSMVENEE